MPAGPEKAASLRQSMAWLHTWTGLLPGWVLFLVFLTGTIAFFNSEIDHWMKPELPNTPVSARALAAADAILRSRAPDAQGWSIFLPDGRGGEFGIGWTSQDDEFTHLTLDPRTGMPITPRETHGGAFFYRFHFDFHYVPRMWARYIVSISALAMLLAILSGVLTHKKILADFFMLRLNKGQRSWLDAHNVTGVLALPFHLMITYTGLVIFSYLLVPSVISANFASWDAFVEKGFPHHHGQPSGISAPTLPLAVLLARAAQAGNGARPGGLNIDHPGDAAAMVEVEPRADAFPHPRSHLYLNGATGTVLLPPERFGAAAVTHAAMVDLHAGRLARPVLRWLYFLAGTIGTGMIASGLVLWTVKRRARLPDPDRPHFGFRLVERLNIGVIAGSMAGTASYFLANRSLPLTLPDRADWEIHSMFIAWALTFAWSFARPTRQAWRETLGIGALLFAAVPLVNAATTNRGLLQSIASGDFIRAGFDLTMLATAALMALAAATVSRLGPVPRSRRRGEATTGVRAPG